MLQRKSSIYILRSNQTSQFLIKGTIIQRSIMSSTSYTTHKYTNRLVNETSPYLLQHAHNPVDWMPWSKETIEKAKKEQKPIFLSVGYSTCHWCHVMEKESFENEEIAKIMNDNFVNIKVDREERPDVDRVYMTFVQATTGHGGWPMSVFLTPDLKPFFGGTYFPPYDSMYSRTPGFATLLKKIADMWKTDREKLETSGSKIIEALQGAESAERGLSEQERKKWISNVDQIDQYLENAVKSFLRSFDKKWGGYGGAPKFPRPSIFNFMFRMAYRRTKESKEYADEILHSCLFTLDKMSQGGIYDHLGGGFHRYSVDTEWHVPHFEKMTYDQGQLLVSYSEAYQITKNEHYADIVREIIEYMTRDMTLRESSRPDCEAFFSAEDADSYPTEHDKEKREGAFYVWTHEELEKLLGKGQKDLEIFEYVFGCKPHGNVKSGSDPHGELTGQNVLIQRHSLKEAAENFGLNEDEIRSSVQKSKSILFNERCKRPRPHLDDKVITSWNALMISGLSMASKVLNERKYAEQGERVAKFIKTILYNAENKIIYRAYRSGTSAKLIEGFLADYAYMVAALLDLYEATGNLEWLKWAKELQQKQDELFLDTAKGGYFEVTGKDESILLRMKEDYDGAEPSGNSVSAMNLIRLSQYSPLELANKYLGQVEHLLSNNKEIIENAPQVVPQLLCALDERVRPGKHITIVYDSKCAGVSLDQVVTTIHQQHVPSKTLFFFNRDDQDVAQFVQDNIPYLSDTVVKDGKPTIYICQNFSCQPPMTDLEELKKELSR
jgi:uncharacterized protein YyaL (SSP411 family)